LFVGATALAGGALWGVPRWRERRRVDLPPLGSANGSGGDYKRYLRDTSNDGWRQKVVRRGSSLARRTEAMQRIDPNRPLPPGEPGRDYMPVITPNNSTLAVHDVDGVKVFHLIAEESATNSPKGWRVIAGGTTVISTADD